jgi:hypothetical protein
MKKRHGRWKYGKEEEEAIGRVGGWKPGNHDHDDDGGAGDGDGCCTFLLID